MRLQRKEQSSGAGVVAPGRVAPVWLLLISPAWMVVTAAGGQPMASARPAFGC